MKKFLNRSKGKIWFLINMFFTIIYLIWRIFFTIPLEYGKISIFAGISLLLVEALGMVEAFVHYTNMYSVESYPLPKVPEERMPHVDVFIATYSEEPSLLYKTINGCLHMDYPDKNKVHIYLCDDNRRPEMRALAEKMGINYLDRPDNKGAKAGNLNNAMAHSNSPYIVTFDADMIPKSDFLLKMIPYVVDNEMKNEGRKKEDQIKIGFVQSPQCFYNPDLFQFNLFSEGRIPNEQDYFYRDIQVARTKTNSVIYGGSNTVLCREALNEIGGFYTEAITEDFATGILIEKKGYVSLGIGEPLASGLSPVDLQSLIQQRTRWARGVVATGRKMHIYTSSDYSFSQKMNYWASIWYWYAPIKRLIYIMSPILYATFGFMVFKCTLPQVLIFWLPMYVSSNISLRMLSGNIRNTKWTGIYETVMFPFMLIPVVLESFGITLKKFKVTNKKEQKNQKGKNHIYAIPFLILIVLSIIGIIRCIFIMFDSGSFGPIVVLFWLINNLFFLVMAILFVDGRIPYRKSERVKFIIPCTLNDGIQELHGTTRDFSETGISVLFDEPYYLEPDSLINIELQWKSYHVKLQAQIVFVTKFDKKWSYSMVIKDYMNTYDDYLQIIYDRVPILPQEIKKHSGSFEDLKINTQKRIATPFFQKRQYPRILLNVEIPCMELEGGRLKVIDFNYSYLTTDKDINFTEITLVFAEDIRISCAYEQKKHLGQRIYKIKNMDEVIRNKSQYNNLLKWIKENHEKALLVEEKRIKEERKQQKEKEKKEFNESDIV